MKIMKRMIILQGFFFKTNLGRLNQGNSLQRSTKIKRRGVWIWSRTGQYLGFEYRYSENLGQNKHVLEK